MGAELLSIPVIMALIEVMKMSGLSSKYAPAMSVLLGVAFALLVLGFNVEGAVTGLVLGLSASGLYSGGGKKVLNVNK